MITLNHPITISLFLGFTLGLGALCLSPILQADTYHQFADQTLFLGIPNAIDVFSNSLFLFVGVYGLLRRPRFSLNPSILVGLIGFLIGLILMSIGLSYYHLSPSNETLLWSRLSISMSMMAVCFGLIASQAKLRYSVLTFIIMQGVGISITLHCYFTSDLRFFMMSQVFPLLLLFFSATRLRGHSTAKALIYCTLFYVLGKMTDHYDVELYTWTSEWISGHSLNHIFSAMGAFFLLQFFLYLKPAEISQQHPHLMTSKAA